MKSYETCIGRFMVNYYIGTGNLDNCIILIDRHKTVAQTHSSAKKN